METENVIIVSFNTKEEGLVYLTTSEFKFTFTDGINIYNSDGDIISLDINYDILPINEIYIKNLKKVRPLSLGELFLENNLIKYIK